MSNIFQQMQEKDGVRLPWNVWPHIGLATLQNQTGAQKAAQFLTGGDVNSLMGGGASLGAGGQRLPLPISALYTPAQRLDLEKRPGKCLSYNLEPAFCLTCRAVLNPCCYLDYTQRKWHCCFCGAINTFPASYNGYFERNQKPLEMQEPCTTMEYYFSAANKQPPVYLFLVDVSMSLDELKSVKQSISIICNSIPQNSLVGIMSFGSVVMLHELFEVHDFFKTNVFSGSKKVDISVIRSIIETQIRLAQEKSQNQPQEGGLSSNQFFAQYGSCDLEFSNILDSLMPEGKAAVSGKFEKRCTGVALDLAINLLATLYPSQPGKLITFIGGPITHGPGTIVSEKDLVLRQFIDINSGNASMTPSSLKFFTELAQKAAKNHLTVDLYSGYVDQFGLYELKYFPLLTNGNVLLYDSFSSNAFRQSIKKLYSEIETQSYLFDCMVEVKTSRGLKVMGCIGPCSPADGASSNVSKMTVGIGGTTKWRLNSADENTTLAFYFEGPSSIEDVEKITSNKENGYIQFIFGSTMPNGTRKMRVTTISRKWVDVTNGGIKQIAPGFDEVAAIVTASRYAIYAFEFEDNPDCVKWLDKMLIALVKTFADYSPNMPSTLSIPSGFQMFPQFIFHLRRSNLITTFNISPDESTYVKNMFIKSSIMDNITMIQPSLLSTSFQGTHPVILDAASIRPDNILILDSFFIVLVYFGEQISAWIKNNYHLMPEYAHLKKLIDYAQQIASSRIQTRKPTPRYVITFHDGSQARFLFAKVNPSKLNEYGDSNRPANILTDDVSMQLFIEELKKLAVAEEVK